MKYKLFVLLFCTIICSCHSTTPDTFDKEIVILVDQTDSMAARPDEDHIYESLGLSNDKFQGIRITLSSISEKDIIAR